LRVVVGDTDTASVLICLLPEYRKRKKSQRQRLTKLQQREKLKVGGKVLRVENKDKQHQVQQLWFICRFYPHRVAIGLIFTT